MQSAFGLDPLLFGHVRIVDCKYLYNLATSSLSGTGKYKVEVVIDGQAVDGATYFSIK